MLQSRQGVLAIQELVNGLKTQIATLKTAQSKGFNIADLKTENAALKSEIEGLKKELEMFEMLNGKKQVVISAGVTSSNDVTVSGKEVSEQKPEVKKDLPKAEGKKKGKPKVVAEKKVESEGPVDIGRLDLRIGVIEKAEKHPDADSLYVETVNVGEEKPRTIISGLANHIPLPDMQQRKAVFLLNLKPAKMRGILSEGMIMCASKDGKVEILSVPLSSQPGDRLAVGDFNLDNPDSQLNPKKKIWETLKPECLVDANGFATFRGARWTVRDKGDIRAPSLTGAHIS